MKRMHHMNASPSSPSKNTVMPPHKRRGVLLLIVLSMLTLFLMLGTAYLVVSTRSRETARAFARLAMQADDTRIPHAPLLDAAFLAVIRGGTTAPTLPGPQPTPQLDVRLRSTSPPTNSAAFPALTTAFESLLEDKYGSSTTGAISGSCSRLPNSPLLEASSVTLSDAAAAGIANPLDLVGRVVTLLGPRRRPTSHRVVFVTGTASPYTLTLDTPPAFDDTQIPSAGSPIPIVVNGPEFTPHAVGPDTTRNEPWDAFDNTNNNPFLCLIAPGATASQTSPLRVAFANDSELGKLSQSSPSGLSYGADNDNDGSLDGFYYDIGLPKAYHPNGDEVRFDVSALIIDLDSRFNINAHGSLSSLCYPNDTTDPHTHAGWAATGFDSTNRINVNLRDRPLGGGYGPAEIPFAPIARAAANSLQSDEYPQLCVVSGISGTNAKGLRPSYTRFNAGSYTYRLAAAEGRYGGGTAYATDGATLSQLQSNDWTLSADSFPLARPGQKQKDDQPSCKSDRSTANVGPNSATNYGIPAQWWSGSPSFDWLTEVTGTLPHPRNIYNSPPDLQGRMIVVTSTSSSCPTPILAFFKPEWGENETTDDPYEIRLRDTRLRSSRLVAEQSDAGNRDNLFSAAELESLLRPYDFDTAQLSQRLPFLLGSASENLRLRLTTDSWDTTALTGSAAQLVRQYFAGNPVYSGTSPVSGRVGGEVARGEKFNLNRPLAASTTLSGTFPTTPAELMSSEYHLQRQAYFKDLFTLLVALGKPADVATAQWAANVLEFRDADSRITPFEYDMSPATNWRVDGVITSDEGTTARGVVWGVERPEILIQSACAWRHTLSGSAGLVVTLHRPWNALSYAAGTTSLPAEPCDPAFDTLSAGTSGRPTNVVDLGKKAGPGTVTATNASYDDFTQDRLPIWRLRIVGGGQTRYVRFDTNAPGADEFALGDVMGTSGNEKPKLAVNQSLVVASGTAVKIGTAMSPGTAYINTGGEVRIIKDLAFPNTVTSGTVFLERLSDPVAFALTFSGSIPSTGQAGADVWTADPLANTDRSRNPLRYIVVDACPVTVAQTDIPSPTAHVTQKGAGQDFWLPAAVDSSQIFQDQQPLSLPRQAAYAGTAWFPWSNRPFTSAAELYLVPPEDQSHLLSSYVRPDTVQKYPAVRANSIPLWFFDAAHVPTRYADVHRTLDNVSESAMRAATLWPETNKANQLSSFREPGRVNLNTVTTDEVWNAVVAGPLKDSSGNSSPVKPRGSNPATTFSGTNYAAGMHHLLALAGTSSITTSGTVPIIDTHDTLTTRQQAINPVHGLYTATRLANTTTTRSHVFAIWITVRECAANDPDSIRIHRAFYIFDRSIPVAFQPGRDHNVWDAVLLRRIIQ
jgi:hypothetical protein